MVTATQQQAKSMAQQYQQVNNQNFIDNRTSQAYQQQKNDYNQQYDKQQNDMYLWAQNKQSIKSTDDAINRTTQNNQQVLQLQQRQSEVAQANNTKTFSGGGDYFGTGAAQPSGYKTDIYGMKSSVNGSQLADWQNRQASAMNSIKQGSEANAAGDVLRTEANSTAQQALARNQAATDAARQAQQNSYDAQMAGQNRTFQAQESARDRESRQQLALTQAYSINPGSFRYW